MADGDFLIDHVSAMMKQTTLPAEIVLSVKEGATCYKGRAVAMTIAGEPVIVIARTIPQLDIVFNKLCPTETLRTSACPEILIVQATNAKLDDDL